ncbi:unnamed protein product (macronuclear) [Paramecium tetraurelia]|uniref:Transmembrane protein n=1 Tax=Paramecium tetraurelia TaxID=5888 RepID=A0BN03_PARTE|nr:uncharacterized protein GSPATT00030557001 [Paramecium tetraurelia]CAK59920.1 unnamed protein product [Paramecium tetraurelia]|eukprot:XP_001427318.1 hypothetical protein (macronuclear) [Paramecium tetraurelia strain d4-2]
MEDQEKEKSRKPMTLSQRIRMELSQQQEEKKPVEGPQLIKHKPSSYDEETGQLYSFYASAVNQTSQFFSNIFGGTYIPQYQYSFKHKQNVIKYVFEKNNVIAEYVSKEMRKSQQEKDLNDLLQLQNRMMLVAQLADCRNRIGISAYCWGALMGSLCMLLPISIWRKGAISMSVFHLFGSYVSQANIDRVFDKVYQFYVQDLEEYKKERQNITVGQIKQSKLDRDLEDKRLRKYLREISKQQ